MSSSRPSAALAAGAEHVVLIAGNGRTPPASRLALEMNNVLRNYR